MSDNPEKPTEQWTTGDEPMTGPQRSYLETLAREAGEEVSLQLTKAQASEEIERLQRLTGRGKEHPHHQSLAERVIDEGIVDQQSVIVEDQATG
jgi:hypothetical protein